LLSTGRSPVDSFFLDATPSGDDALIATRERLVGVDSDQAFDLYDVRVGGGIAAQSPPGPAVECSGEGCRGPASATPVDSTPVRVEFGGGGDPLQVGGLLGQLNLSAGVFRVHPLGGRAVRRLAAGGRVTLRVSVSGPGRVRARVRARVRGRERVVAAAGGSAARGGRVGLRLRLSPGARAALRRRGRLRVAVVVTYSEVFGAQRATLTLTRPDGSR
jgi:hypothetical protein